MKFDTQLKADSFRDHEDQAVRAEHEGHDGIWSAETDHDPFLPLVLAAAKTTRIEIGTAVAVAFARSPMTLAATAHDLQLLSGGRMNLGIGSQVKAHVERRFGMPWSRPADRMREFILAMRAIWSCWDDGNALLFEGEFYRHTLMTPMFSPPSSPWGPPTVHLAAMGDRMVSVAAEVADGLILHAFNTGKSISERTLPVLESALRAHRRQRADVQVSLPILVATGPDAQQQEEARRRVRQQIAFYASTPTYRWILELHGWEGIGEQLTVASRSAAESRWADMADLVTDEMLDTFAVVANPEDVAAAVQGRFAGRVDRLSLYYPYEIATELRSEIAADMRHLLDQRPLVETSASAPGNAERWSL